MSEPNERTELLINRRLDGVLSSEEQLELDRALIRSPELRQTLEESERIDAACSSALASIADVPTEPVSDLGPQRLVRRSSSRVWWALPAAMAAGLAFLVLSGRAPDASVGTLALVDDGPLTPVATSEDLEANGGTPIDGRRLGIEQASGLGHATDRRLDRRFYGIPAGDERLLLIEVERTRTYQYPRVGGKYRLVPGDL